MTEAQRLTISFAIAAELAILGPPLWLFAVLVILDVVVLALTEPPLA